MFTAQQLSDIRDAFVGTLFRANLDPTQARLREPALAMLATFPELRNQVFVFNETPITFGYLLSASPAGRSLLTAMVSTFDGMSTLEQTTSTFSIDDLPSSVRALAPSALIEGTAARLAPALSVNELACQVLPFYDRSQLNCPSNLPLRRLENALNEAQLPQLRGSFPDLPGLVALPTHGEIPGALLILIARPLHQHLPVALRDLLAKITPETGLEDLVNYGESLPSEAWRIANARRVELQDQALSQPVRHEPATPTLPVGTENAPRRR